LVSIFVIFWAASWASLYKSTAFVTVCNLVQSPLCIPALATTKFWKFSVVPYVDISEIFAFSASVGFPFAISLLSSLVSWRLLSYMDIHIATCFSLVKSSHFTFSPCLTSLYSIYFHIFANAGVILTLWPLLALYQLSSWKFPVLLTCAKVYPAASIPGVDLVGSIQKIGTFIIIALYEVVPASPLLYWLSAHCSPLLFFIILPAVLAFFLEVLITGIVKFHFL